MLCAHMLCCAALCPCIDAERFSPCCAVLFLQNMNNLLNRHTLDERLQPFMKSIAAIPTGAVALQPYSRVSQHGAVPLLYILAGM